MLTDKVEPDAIARVFAPLGVADSETKSKMKLRSEFFASYSDSIASFKVAAVECR
jgi:hypothetical protein